MLTEGCRRADKAASSLWTDLAPHHPDHTLIWPGPEFTNLNGWWGKKGFSPFLANLFYCFVRNSLCQPIQILLTDLVYLFFSPMFNGKFKQWYLLYILFFFVLIFMPNVPDYRQANVCAPSNCCMLTGFQNNTFLSIIKAHNYNWLSPSHKTLCRLSLLSVWGFMQRGELLCVGVSAYTLSVIMQAIMA